MTVTVTSAESAVEHPEHPQDDVAPGRLRRFLDRDGVDAGFLLAGSVLLLVVVVGLLASWLAPYGPLEMDLQARSQGPSTAHPLGTDNSGRDVLSRLMHGTRTAFGGVLLALGVAAAIGLVWGLVSGYAGGRIDGVLMRLADTALAFPGLVLAVAITGVLGPSLTNSMIAVGVVFSPTVARLLRSAVLPLRNAEFVLISRSLGLSSWRAAIRHVLPNALAPAFVQLCAIASLALIIEASLSFLGLGVQPPAPSWGGDLADAYGFFASAPMATVAPGLVITACALCLLRLGDGLRVILRTE